MATRTVLVAGASGLIGHAALDQFVRDGGWDVIGISRSVPDDVPGATVIALDLTDPAACRRTLGPVGGVTHLVYAALQEGPGLLPGWFEAELIERNGAMLRNLLDALDLDALQHVSLLQGTKAYGVHRPDIGPDRAPLPLRERAPRVEHPNFYWLQEDELRARQADGGWGLTIFRPTVVYGATGQRQHEPAPGDRRLRRAATSRRRTAALPRRRDPPHRSARPSTPTSSPARCAGRRRPPAAAGGTFNLTNGDVFCWDTVWPVIAATFGIEVGEHRPMSFAADLPTRDAEWAELVERHALLAPPDRRALRRRQLARLRRRRDGRAAVGVPVRQQHDRRPSRRLPDCLDTADMFVDLLRRMAARRLIPPLP